jgi:uncharacterized membrane protein (UPF0127 family)
MPYLVVMLLALAACQALPAPGASGTAPPPAIAALPSAEAGATPVPDEPIPQAMASHDAAPTAVPTAPGSCAPTTSKAYVQVEGRKVAVDLAWTPEDRAHGLSGRPCLAQGTGLVLGWDAPTMARIWMPDMNFPIDVVFVRANKVVMVFADAQPCKVGERCPTFGPGTPVDYVLEVPAGSAKAWGVETGDAIALHR